MPLAVAAAAVAVAGTISRHVRMTIGARA